MRIKRLSGVRVELEGWEAEEIVKEIQAIVDSYDRSGATLFPLTLHGLKEALKEEL